MKLDPRHLIQLSKIVEKKSFSLAAKDLGLTQPALSRTVRILEGRLGSAVLLRTRGDIRPTSIGQVLADFGASVRAQTFNAETFADDVASGAVGEIRIGAPPLLAEYTLAEPLLEFAQANEGLIFRVETGLASSLLEMLAQGQLDIVVAPIGTVDRASGFAVKHILDHRSRLYGRKGHPITGNAITKRELSDVRWAALKPSSLIRSNMDIVLSTMGIDRIHVAFECTSEGMLLNLIEMSDMLTILPGRSSANWLLGREIQELPFKHEQLLFPIGIVTRESVPLSEIQRDLHSYLVVHASSATT